MLFNSRGFKDAAAKKGSEMEQALLAASENGKYPIVIDTSPCLSQVRVLAAICILPQQQAAQQVAQSNVLMATYDAKILLARHGNTWLCISQ
jgi:hypothetical protein